VLIANTTPLALRQLQISRRQKPGPTFALPDLTRIFARAYPADLSGFTATHPYSSPNDSGHTKAFETNRTRVNSTTSPKLTVKQVAKRLQVDPETIRRWARNKIIPAIKLTTKKRGVWRFSLKDIEQWERKNTTGRQELSEASRKHAATPTQA
jgi:excisionase family DNA binding protein